MTINTKATATEDRSSKPLIVIACTTIVGHTLPLLPHATELAKQGFDVSFIGGREFESLIHKTGATFYPIENLYSLESLEYVETIPDRIARGIWSLKTYFIDITASRMKSLQTVLESLREKHPNREVILIQELGYMGTWPFLLGAPLPKGYERFPKTFTFSTAPLLVSSVDTAPFGRGSPPDSSDDGRARNAAMYAAEKPVRDHLVDYTNSVYASLGATTKVDQWVFDLWSTGHTILLQPCSPSLEYPRSDLSPKVRFIGGTPREKIDPSTPLPEWWCELETNRRATDPKKVVFVTQGTIKTHYKDLVIPTMQAFANRSDVMVISVLGVKGAVLDENHKIPDNAKVIDYLSYDAVLPYVDVFVTNGGYGSFMHGVMNGVPMVLAGTVQDKGEVCTRGEWAGIGINLRTDTPSPETIRESVERILSDPKYKARSVVIQRENEELDSVSSLRRCILEDK
ncbi:UDP-Glycosyltransferase/glycogen phosphorylase [Aspergillus eucalypticola CBS 122712]|uniref:UDP-Glycosyltransferase/glycogen phosphorylase n=1 Tax=Aspergillus eucalypticola (strain CBS 122712 / IBT 29274) TaxID=1448314 RepID=A0A317US10_ASPEC|nr:UDP-Glycosyltransferase/glycogen phosphorylase [Aspergillus eucalypticola CBS 122712]PWY64441.1 UDP-Glycosyltransferase/glycogen phosphorylase [Aspergillus eucalypticola CBS 122712]